MIPVPVLRVLRRGQRKAGEVESHPRPAAIHVLAEGGALRRVVRPRVEKKNDLIAREKFSVEVAPVRRRFVAEVVRARNFGKPAVGLFHEAHVGEIVHAGVEGNDLESGSGRRLLCAAGGGKRDAHREQHAGEKRAQAQRRDTRRYALRAGDGQANDAPTGGDGRKHPKSVSGRRSCGTYAGTAVG